MFPYPQLSYIEEHEGELRDLLIGRWEDKVQEELWKLADQCILIKKRRPTSAKVRKTLGSGLEYFYNHILLSRFSNNLHIYKQYSATLSIAQDGPIILDNKIYHFLNSIHLETDRHLSLIFSHTIVKRQVNIKMSIVLRVHLSGMNLEECVAPMPGLPCFTGL